MCPVQGRTAVMRAASDSAEVIALTHPTAIGRAIKIAAHVVAPAAASNDKLGRFSAQAGEALGGGGLLGLVVPTEFGGPGLGARAFAAVTAALAEADASVAMVYMM